MTIGELWRRLWYLANRRRIERELAEVLRGRRAVGQALGGIAIAQLAERVGAARGDVEGPRDGRGLVGVELAGVLKNVIAVSGLRIKLNQPCPVVSANVPKHKAKTLASSLPKKDGTYMYAATAVVSPSMPYCLQQTLMMKPASGISTVS